MEDAMMGSHRLKVSVALVLLLLLLGSGAIGNVSAQTPPGWGGGGKGYEISLDRTVKHGGQASGSIKSTVEEPDWYAALTQSFQADGFRGKRFRLSAYVKSKDVHNSAALWMRIESIDGAGNYCVTLDHMKDRPINGTNDWKRCEIVLDVPNEDVARIVFGALLAGKGQIWVDDFKFETVDRSVKTTGQVREPVLGNHALPMGLPKEPSNLDFEHVEPRPAAATAREPARDAGAAKAAKQAGEILKSALGAADQVKDEPRRAFALMMVGTAQARSGERDGAAKTFTQAVYTANAITHADPARAQGRKGMTLMYLA
jgi:hypothetical protein